jgi:hypothetical protein
MAKGAIPGFSASLFNGSINMQEKASPQDRHGNMLINFRIPEAE